MGDGSPRAGDGDGCDGFLRRCRPPQGADYGGQGGQVTEQVRCGWHEIEVWTADGSLCIAKKNDKKVSENLSYQDCDNVHVLEAVIRTFFKSDALQLSELL